VPRLYVGHYVGDYDAPSWLYKAVPAFFRDPKHGQVPLGWAFDLNLADRAPQALAYAYRHASHWYAEVSRQLKERYPEAAVEVVDRIRSSGSFGKVRNKK
jgi:hypothetical protein